MTVLLGTFLLLAFASVGGILIARERLAELRGELLVQASEQRTLLNTIAETTARNGADTVTERIVIDCTVDERTKFDSLLSRLNDGLPKSDLAVLERLFGRCGSFYAQRKAVMVARLEREVEVYANYVAQLQEVGGVDTEEYKLTVWQSLVEDEKIQSKEFGSLVAQQDSIISALLAGRSPASPEIVSILEEVKRVQQALGSANTNALEKRRELIAL